MDKARGLTTTSHYGQRTTFSGNETAVDFKIQAT